MNVIWYSGKFVHTESCVTSEEHGIVVRAVLSTFLSCDSEYASGFVLQPQELNNDCCNIIQQA